MNTDTYFTRVCMYLRKSRKDRDDLGESIEETLRKHEEQLMVVAKRLKLNIVAIKKEVATGDSIAVRPLMQELIEESTDGLYDAILVMDIDRLGRGDMVDQGYIINTFKHAGVKIITPSKSYDLDDEYDEDFFDMSAFFARKELKMIKRRLQRGRLKSLEEGYYLSPTAPFGYDKVKRNLVINETELPTVKLIFDLYLNKGFGDTKIARYLEDHGIKTKRGNRWDRTAIRRLVTNPIYSGFVCFNKRKFYIGESGKRNCKWLPREDWTLHKGRHEAIMPEDTFKRVIEISHSRFSPHVTNKAPLRNPLAFLFKCGSCDTTMTIRTCKGKPDSLRCYRHCGGISGGYINVIEKVFISQLNDMLLNFISSYDSADKEDTISNEIKLLQDSLDSLAKELKKYEQIKERQFELLEDGTYDKNTFLERTAKLADNISEAFDKKLIFENKIADLQSQLCKYTQILPKYQDARAFINNIYWESNVEEKNEFLRDIVDHVVYFKAPHAEQMDFTLDITLKF